MDHRLEALKHWLDRVLEAREYSIRPASTDASFRRYFRVRLNGRSYIAMDAPPDKEDSARYAEIARVFFDLGLNVPEIFHQDPGAGFLLISDLGEHLYLDRLNPDTVERLYGDALGALVVLQAGTFLRPGFLPDYGAERLLAEMMLFRDWYLERHLGLRLDAEQDAVLRGVFDRLVEQALEQPQVWVHRDYHSRNLMLTPTNNPGILDFQDAVRGPVTYDLVSLLRDCYIAWPRERVEDWAKGYQQLALQSGIPVCEDEDMFLQWFDWMGVQRHLKAVGIFARLCHRDGKAGYLEDIPRTLAYAREVSRRHRELAPLAEFLDSLGPDGGP